MMQNKITLYITKTLSEDLLLDETLKVFAGNSFILFLLPFYQSIR